jgi:hypothetical protein
MELSSKHRTTLEAIFADPVRSGIAWRDIEALFVTCGGDVRKGKDRGYGSP